jgi:hypothetical protein
MKIIITCNLLFFNQVEKKKEKKKEKEKKRSILYSLNNASVPWELSILLFLGFLAKSHAWRLEWIHSVCLVRPFAMIFFFSF